MQLNLDQNGLLSPPVNQTDGSEITKKLQGILLH